MYSREFVSLPIVIKAFLPTLAWYLPYTALIYVAYSFLGWEFLDIKMSIATVLGFAVSLVLGFRTSAAYDRWWEARKIWGGIVNDSRSLIRQAIGFTQGKEGAQNDVNKLAKYQTGWCYALKNSLRNIDDLKEVESFIEAVDNNRLSEVSNKPNELLQLMEKILAKMFAEGSVNEYQHVAMNQTLNRLCDHMGKAERIKNTVFPTQYRSFTHKGILLFILMLPYGMLYSTGPFVMLICCLVSLGFFILETIGYYLQDPFENRGSDTPMTAICRTIEINLKEMINEKEIPNFIQPDHNGILM